MYKLRGLFLKQRTKAADLERLKVCATPYPLGTHKGCPYVFNPKSKIENPKS